MASGPTNIGGAQTNNGTSVSFASVAVPQGALIFNLLATSAPDTAVISASDSKGNSYQIQSQNQPIGAPISLVLSWAFATQALTTADTLGVTANARFQLIDGALYYTGAQANFVAYDIEYSQGTGLSYTVTPNAGSTLRGYNLLAMIAVNGPQSDGFTQAVGWGTDIGGGVGNAGYSIHGGAMIANSDGPIIYAPTLGRARWSVGFLLAFK